MAPTSMSIDAVGGFLLHEQHARRRAALPGAVEGRAHGIAHHLLGQRGGIRDHGVDAAGLGDERHDGAAALGQRLLDRQRGLIRAGEEMPLMRVSLTSASPSRATARASRCSALGGTPASCSSFVARKAVIGVCSAGLATTALPAASAAATWPVKMASGKFHGEMQAKTPRPLSGQRVALAGRAREHDGPANRRRACTA